MRQPPDYDPLLLRLGGTLSTPTLLVDNTYYPWTTVNGQGRLSRINAGPQLTPTTLLNLYYTYDAVGNILTVKDHVMGSSTKVPQTQTFTYDALNRLTSASASGGLNGVGDYALENYTYSTSTGNLASKGILNYVYGGQAATCPDGSLSQAHAVKSIMISDNPPLHRFCYDRNGNLVQRSGTVNYTLAYDAENRLITSTAGSSSFVYDGDGNRVKATVDGVTTLYIGNYFEININTDAMVKYYYAGGQRIAMRNGDTTGTSGLYWLLADHLGSTNKVVNANGTLHSWQLYKAWGEWRAGSTPGLLTDYTFTGQKVVSGVGLYFYGARWYDSSLSHFVQADSIIPDPYNPLDWNRYAYARYNPLVYTDPTGHWPEWLDRALEFAQGVAYQFTNDMTGGAVDSLAASDGVLCMDCNASHAYKQGQQVGRTASTVVASAEFVLGAAATAAALAAIPTTSSGGIVCTALSGGVCALPTGAVVAIEAVIAAGGVVVAGHGTVTVEYIKSNPLTSGDATSAAKKLGYTRRIPPQKAPFNSHGQTVYYNSTTKTYITIDIDQHRGPGWKMFDSKGNRIGTYDLSLENLIGK